MITLDGNDLKEFDLVVLENHDNPLLPFTRDNTIEIPGMHGVHDMGSDLGPKYFNIPLGFRPQKSYEDLRKKAESFIHLLIDSYGKPKSIKLRFNYFPERYYTVKYSGQLPLQRLMSMGRFDLPLIAYDPHAYASSTAYDQEPVEYDSGVQYDSGIMLENTEQFTWTYPRHYSGVHNYSYYATPFSFMVEGQVINPRFTNLNTGKTFAINISVAEDERLYVDSKRSQVWKVKIREDKHFWLAPDFLMSTYEEWDRVNLYNEAKGKFPELVEGDNGFLFEGGLPNATVYFNWQHKFM